MPELQEYGRDDTAVDFLANVGCSDESYNTEDTGRDSEEVGLDGSEAEIFEGKGHVLLRRTRRNCRR